MANRLEMGLNVALLLPAPLFSLLHHTGDG